MAMAALENCHFSEAIVHFWLCVPLLHAALFCVCRKVATLFGKSTNITNFRLDCPMDFVIRFNSQFIFNCCNSSAILRWMKQETILLYIQPPKTFIHLVRKILLTHTHTMRWSILTKTVNIFECGDGGGSRSSREEESKHQPKYASQTWSLHLIVSEAEWL